MKEPLMIRSIWNHDRCWELWYAGRGERTIEKFERTPDGDMLHRTSAYIRTRKRRELVGGRNKTTVTWDVYLHRWSKLVSSGHSSPEAAMRAYCKLAEPE